MQPRLTAPDYAALHPGYDALFFLDAKLKIGILETSNLNPEVVKQYGSFSDMFQKLLLTVDSQLKFKEYKTIEFDHPEDLNECDAYLITGSKHSVYENEEWMNQLMQLSIQLHQKKIKQVGICFGHQLIAQALGGMTEKSENGWGVGHNSYSVKEKLDWMRPEKENFSLLASHQDQVVKLPPQASLIAGNSFCVNAGFQIDGDVLTFQGHPEFSREYLEHIMNKRREQLGEEIYNKAKLSLTKEDDHGLVAQWIVNFVNQQ